ISCPAPNFLPRSHIELREGQPGRTEDVEGPFRGRVMASAQTVNRRGFLAMSLAAGAVATGVAAGRSAAAPATGVNWTALRRALDGALIRPGDPAYAAAARPFNAALGIRSPAAIAQVRSRADVATC